MRIIVLVLLLLWGTPTVPCKTEDGPQIIPIRILDNSEETERINRMPALVPIVAYYNSSTSAVFIQFLHDFGDMGVNINTKGGNGRHVAAVATDVIVGVALSGVTGFWGAVAAAAVSALASEAMENGEMDPDSGTD